MKIYSNTFDLVRPDNKRIWVGPNSDFKIGVKVLSDGEETTGKIALYDGEDEIQAEEDKVDGFTVFPMKSTSLSDLLGQPSEKNLRAEYNGKTNFYINLTTTKSTVFEVEGEGGVSSVTMTGLKTTGSTLGVLHVDDQDYTIKSGDIEVQDLTLGTESNPGELKIYEPELEMWTGIKMMDDGPYPYPALGCPTTFQAQRLATNTLRMGDVSLGYEQDQEGNDVFGEFNTVLVDASKCGQDSRFNTVKIMDVNDLDNEFVQMDMINGMFTIGVNSEMDGSVELSVSDPSKIRFNIGDTIYVGQIENGKLVFVEE